MRGNMVSWQYNNDIIMRGNMGSVCTHFHGIHEDLGVMPRIDNGTEYTIHITEATPPQ